MKDQISETEAAVTEDKTEVKTADSRKENIGKFPKKNFMRPTMRWKKSLRVAVSDLKPLKGKLTT